MHINEKEKDLTKTLEAFGLNNYEEI